MATRLDPLVVVRHIVRNQSERSSGTKIQLLVVHATESSQVTGSGDLKAIGNWFDRVPTPSDSGSSSHVCTDADGLSGRYVYDKHKAWHVSSFNSVSLGVEQIGRAAQSSWDVDECWETARWLARWSLVHKVPLEYGAVTGSKVTRPGVLCHSDLGVAGGGHHDPGSGYPLQDVLEHARFVRYRLARRGTPPK